MNLTRKDIKSNRYVSRINLFQLLNKDGDNFMVCLNILASGFAQKFVA